MAFATAQMEEDDRGFPYVESVGEVLDAIQLIDNPGLIFEENR
jgi:hypothetical protein